MSIESEEFTPSLCDHRHMPARERAEQAAAQGLPKKEDARPVSSFVPNLSKCYDCAKIMSIRQQLRQPTALSRGIDYLGDLGAKLRDLQGDRTLAYELIQNADDARTATSMSFDVTTEALTVDNDGTLSDCGVVEQSECPWKHASDRGYRCDFHRIRNIASDDKRAEPGTTGAFGIGFIDETLRWLFSSGVFTNRRGRAGILRARL